MKIACGWLCALMLFSASAAAYEQADGKKIHCEFTRDGKIEKVAELWVGDGVSASLHADLGGTAAVTRHDANNTPTIIFDKLLLNPIIFKNRAMRDLIFFHECEHAKNPTLTEIEANCYGLIAMQSAGLINKRVMNEIAGFHQGLQRLPDQYGGNGVAFWEMTLACVRQQGNDDWLK